MIGLTICYRESYVLSNTLHNSYLVQCREINYLEFCHALPDIFLEIADIIDDDTDVDEAANSQSDDYGGADCERLRHP